MNKHLWRAYDCVFMALLLLLVFDLSLRLSPIVSAATVTPIATATTIATATPINTATPVATVTPMAVYTEDLSINPWDVLRGGGEDGIVYCSPNNEYSWCTSDGKELMYDLVVISTPDIFGGPAPLTTATATPTPFATPVYTGFQICVGNVACGTGTCVEAEYGQVFTATRSYSVYYGSITWWPYTICVPEYSSGLEISNLNIIDGAIGATQGLISFKAGFYASDPPNEPYYRSQQDWYVGTTAGDNWWQYNYPCTSYEYNVTMEDMSGGFCDGDCGYSEIVPDLGRNDETRWLVGVFFTGAWRYNTLCPWVTEYHNQYIEFTVGNVPTITTPTPTPTPDEDSFKIIPNCDDEDSEYLALLGNLGDWTISSITAPFDFEFLPSDGSPAYIDTIYMTDTMEYGYYWDLDEIELSFEPDFVPWIKYYRWVCLDDDLNVVGDDLGDLGDIIDDWVSVRDGAATCFTIPLETITTVYGTFDQILEILPDIDIQEDIEICMFPRIVKFETHLSFLNPFAILIMWAFTGMIVFGILRGI